MKKGDIVLVLFPFTNLVAEKLRPALVLANVNNGKDYIMCAISSKKNTNSIDISNVDLQDGLLPKDSYILYEKIVTLDVNIIDSKVATLNPKTYKKVLSKIYEILK